MGFKYKVKLMTSMIVLQMSYFYGGPVLHKGFPGGSVVKNPPDNAGDAGLIPGSGGFPRGGTGNPLLYSCL